MLGNDLLQLSQADLQWSTLFAYRNHAKIDGSAAELQSRRTEVV